MRSSARSNVVDLKELRMMREPNIDANNNNTAIVPYSSVGSFGDWDFHQTHKMNAHESSIAMEKTRNGNTFCFSHAKREMRLQSSNQFQSCNTFLSSHLFCCSLRKISKPATIA